MDELKGILKKILKHTPNYESQTQRIEVVERWAEIVGPQVSRHAWAVALLEGGILLVGAESTAWLNSLRYLEPQILEKLNKFFEGPAKSSAKMQRIKGLHFKILPRP